MPNNDNNSTIIPDEFKTFLGKVEGSGDSNNINTRYHENIRDFQRGCWAEKNGVS